MIRSIDHVVVVVRDLEQAAADYGKAGFTVTPGGEHADGATHNALISFADGAYVELIAFKEPDRPQPHRWWPPFAKGEGPVDYALVADDLASEADRLHQAGITVDGPRDGGRVRPDGERIAWRTLILSGTASSLPFVIEDFTPRSLRVPSGEAARHPLGVTGVAGLTVLVADLDAAGSAYSSLLSSSGTNVAPGIAGVARARRFPLGAQWIELAEPAADAGDLRRHLAERGSGPYEVALAVGAGGTGATLPVSATHGARFRIGG